MGGFIAPRRPTPPPAPPPVQAPIQAPTKSEVSQVTSTSSLGITRGKGRSAMNVTGPQGLGNESLTVNKKTLLGG
jgi:hypothetical protein|tara:strand:+ start:1518 stop:1742 length:225 start_codon:yes stop_codon:yes gene_type:complete